jgi:RNA recognition motif-containing protein
MAEYSGTRLYLGNLHKDGSSPVLFVFLFVLSSAAVVECLVLLLDDDEIDGVFDGFSSLLTPFVARKQDIEDFFKEHGGNIVEVKLMNGFGFIQYDSEADAKEVVPGTQLLDGPCRLLVLSLTLGCPP